jgi:hypothetical protein
MGRLGRSVPLLIPDLRVLQQALRGYEEKSGPCARSRLRSAPREQLRPVSFASVNAQI